MGAPLERRAVHHPPSGEVLQHLACRYPGRGGLLRVESGSVAGKGKGKEPARRMSARPRIARRRLRLLWGIAIVVAATYLYYRPISSYIETRNDLAARQSEVETLRQARTELQLRLVSSTSVTTTEREARRLGYVKPGEQLFLVKGVSAWRQAQKAERSESGR